MSSKLLRTEYAVKRLCTFAHGQMWRVLHDVILEWDDAGGVGLASLIRWPILAPIALLTIMNKVQIF